MTLLMAEGATISQEIESLPPCSLPQKSGTGHFFDLNQCLEQGAGGGQQGVGEVEAVAVQGQVLSGAGMSPLSGAAVCLVFGAVLYLAALQAQGVDLRRIFRLRTA